MAFLTDDEFFYVPAGSFNFPAELIEIDPEGRTRTLKRRFMEKGTLTLREQIIVERIARERR